MAGYLGKSRCRSCFRRTVPIVVGHCDIPKDWYANMCWEEESKFPIEDIEAGSWFQNASARIPHVLAG